MDSDQNKANSLVIPVLVSLAFLEIHRIFDDTLAQSNHTNMRSYVVVCSRSTIFCSPIRVPSAIAA